MKANELAAYDTVVYGGWIMANMVYGYDKIKALKLKNVIVFGVGMSIPSEEVAAKIAVQNEIKQENLFYFEGGYDPKKVGFLKKMMMNMIKKSIEQKIDKTEDDIHMLETFKGADCTNRESIKPLIHFVNAKE